MQLPILAAHVAASGLNTFTSAAIDTTLCDSFTVFGVWPRAGTVPTLTDSAGNTWTNQGTSNGPNAANSVTIGKWSCGRNSVAAAALVSATHTFTFTGTNIQAAMGVQGFRQDCGVNTTFIPSQVNPTPGLTATPSFANIAAENFNPALLYGPRYADGTLAVLCLGAKLRTAPVTFTTPGGIIIDQILPVAGTQVGIAIALLQTGRASKTGAPTVPNTTLSFAWASGNSLWHLNAMQISPDVQGQQLGALGAG